MLAEETGVTTNLPSPLQAWAWAWEHGSGWIAANPLTFAVGLALTVLGWLGYAVYQALSQP